MKMGECFKTSVITPCLNLKLFRRRGFVSRLTIYFVVTRWTVDQSDGQKSWTVRSQDNSWISPPAWAVHSDVFQLKGWSLTRFNKTEGSFLTPDVIREVQWTDLWHSKRLDLRIAKLPRPYRNYMLQRFSVGCGIALGPM